MKPMATDLTPLRGGEGSGEILCLRFVLAETSQPRVENTYVEGLPGGLCAADSFKDIPLPSWCLNVHFRGPPRM